MSGICGSTNDSQRTWVSGMNAAMVRRGPDAERTYTDYFSGVSLGARRRIIGAPGGHQPLSNEDISVWGVLNGEIYNHSELQEMLVARGHQFASDADAEVLVHLYEEHGKEMVRSLEGMYAFAIWDARRGDLLVGRDRFGEKPLFYAEQGGDLIFASELDAVLAGIRGEPELDPVSIDAFFVFGYVPGPASMVRGVKQLPPGHVLHWTRRSRRVQVDRYWRPATAPAPSSGGPFEDLVSEAGRLLEASVRSRLLADVPLGVFLGGGLDSALIAAFAAKASDVPIKTYTVGYGDPAAADARRVRRTASELGAEHHELILEDEELLRRVPSWLAEMDQPLADPTLVPSHALAEYASRDVSVAIGGDGADELFGGHPRYRWLWRAEGMKRGNTLKRHLDSVTEGRHALRQRLYGAALRGVIGHTGHVGDLAERLNGASRGPVVRRLMILDQLHGLPDGVLVKADRAGMRASLEVRSPYLNRQLAEFAGRVSEQIHIADGGNALLRALLTRVAPEAARQPTATASRAPAAHWLRGPLAPLVDRQLEQGSAFAEDWFDRGEVTELVAEHRAGSRDAGGAIWSLLAFGFWLDRIRGHDVS